MKRLLIISILFFAGIALGQNIHFIKSYGNSGYDFGRDIIQTTDTGYVATGSSSSFGTQTADAFILKIDSLGNFQWSHPYGGPGTDWGESIMLTSDSAYSVAGYTNSYGNGGFDFYLVKATITGTPSWENYYGGADWDKCYDHAQLSDSGFVMVGETYSYGAGLKDGYIVRTDKFGDTLWTKVLGGVENDYFNSVIVDGDSIVVVGGNESVGAGKPDGWIIKMDANGVIGWEKFAGQSEMDYFTSIVKHNNYYVMGGTRTVNLANDMNDFWMYLITEDGLVEMADTSWDGSSPGMDVAHDVAVLAPFDDIYYAGSTTSWGSPDVSSGITDAFISRVTPGYGWLPYAQNFGTVGSDAIYDIETCLDLGIVGIGDADFLSTGGNNIMIFRFDWANSMGYVIDLGAEIVYEDITSGIEDVKGTVVETYPNPTSGMLYFSAAFDAVRIFSLSGEEVLNKSSFVKNIDISGLESGMYILHATLDGSEYTQKIIRQ